ncbi:MAG: glycosyltransferase, partial [Pseudonocardiales bacterium]|nr:glycosyltransferase [Pseudonocardiales bacterium]
MRVLHVITGLAAGGAEQLLRDLLRHSRCEAEVVTLTNAQALAEEIRADGTLVTELGMRHNTDVAALLQLARLIKRGDFDIVHTHLYRACLYGRLAARWASVPTIVATEHSLCADLIEGRPVNRPGIRALYLAAERLGQMTIAVSPTVVDLLVRWGIPRRRIRMIRHGIDVNSFRFDHAQRRRVRAQLGIDPAARVVGTVGRLVPAKRVELLVQAIRDLAETVLLLVGEGSARPALEQLVQHWGLGDRVIFTGESRDISALLSAIDVYATASPHETFGIAVLEAIASGLPTIYVTCPAIDDLPDQAPPGTRRIPSDAAAIRGAIADFLVSPCRLPGPELPMHDIAQTAARMDEL